MGGFDLADGNQLYRKLVFILLLFVITLLMYGKGQKLNKAAIQYNPPEVYMFTSVSNYDPYTPLTTRQMMLSEYAFIHSSQGVMSIHIMYFDSTITNVTEQALRKEYYWKFLNATGVIPGATLRNTTFSVTVPFTARPNDVISFHTLFRASFESNLQNPIYDIFMEYPANTGYLRRHLSAVEVSTFPLLRWRYSDDFWMTWEEILNVSMSLRPAYPPPPEEFNHTYHDVSPHDIKMLENGCARDLFAFYLIVQRRQEHSSIARWGPLTNVYISIPVIMGATGPDWIDMTKSLCMSFPHDCANVESLVLTNAHLLAVSNRGIFVSQPMTSAPLRMMDYNDLPLLSFHLIDPCSQVRDLFYCFTPFGINPLLHSVELHHVATCYIQQSPHFRDIVILVISHDTVDVDGFLSNPVAWTVLYSEQPYTTWHLLIKSAITFDKDLIHNLKAAYYNYQLNHFDFVAQVGHPKYPVSAYVSDERWYVRFIVPMPKKTDKPGYYDVLSTELGDGFLPKVFPRDFEFRKIEVSVGSLDIHFVGNQVWIAESGGRFVYLSIGHLTSEMEYCNFNHPDRYFICVNIEHTEVFVGKVSAYYRAHELHVDDFPDLRDVAVQEGWFAAPSARFDSKVPRFINPGYASQQGRAFEFLARPILLKAIKGVFYRVSNQGNIQIWYMEAGMKTDQSLLPLVPTVKHYKDALFIVTGDGAAPPPDERETFEEAERIVASHIDAFRTIFQSKLAAHAATPARMTLINLKADVFLPFEIQDVRPSLCPFLVDGITVVLYEAKMPGNTGFAKTDVGNTIHCRRKLPGGTLQTTCELYIRHIKFLDSSWLEGFSAVAYAYIIKSIPMHAFACLTYVSVNPRSNDAFIYINKQDKDGTDTVCSNWAREETWHYLGWTFYIPGHFSILITLPEQFTLPDSQPPEPRDNYVDDILFGKTTAKFDRHEKILLSRYEGFLINMASKPYQDWKLPPGPAQRDLHDDDLYPSLPSWYTHPSACLFELLLLPNPVLRSSGGTVALNLHDSVSFTVSLTAILPQGEVMMQQVRLKVTNSNPTVLSLRQQLNKRLTSQTIDITVKPTGYSIGQSTVVVRALSCLPNCETPCALTFIFQVMRAEGQRLTIHYPVTIPTKEILNPEKDGRVYRDRVAIYVGVPVNYRPPSIHGVNIPISTNIYHADPSKPMYRTTYKVSKVSGGEYSKCKDKLNREQCRCSPADKLEDHPFYTDCKETVYKVRRGYAFTIRVTYTPVMEPAFQHQAFFLEKPHLVVWVEEINARDDYSLESKSNSYLKNVNSDKHLHRGKRYYNAEALKFTVYGTGIYHFRAALGEFDTFDDVSGYFMVYSEDFGMDDFSFMLFFFGTLIFAFVFTLCAFLRSKQSMTSHVPIREIADVGKVTKGLRQKQNPERRPTTT